MDQAEIELLIRIEQIRREREAPRDRRQLENVVTVLVAIAVASAWEQKRGDGLPGFMTNPDDYPKVTHSRVMGLFRDDPVFYHTVHTCVAQVICALDDYERWGDKAR